MVATGLATESQPLGSTDVLRRFAAPDARTRRSGSRCGRPRSRPWSSRSCCRSSSATTRIEGRTAVAAIGGVFAACGLIAWRRRPDSRSGAAGWSPSASGCSSSRCSPSSTRRPFRSSTTCSRTLWAIAIIALLLTFVSGGRLETHRGPRAGRRDGRADDRCSSSAHLFLERDGNFLLVHPERATSPARSEPLSAAHRRFACLGHGGGDRRPLQARLGAAAAGDAAERGRHRRPAVFAALAQPSATLGVCCIWLAARLAPARAGGLPRRACCTRGWRAAA